MYTKLNINVTQSLPLCLFFFHDYNTVSMPIHLPFGTRNSESRASAQIIIAYLPLPPIWEKWLQLYHRLNLQSVQASILVRSS
jgi:hypothetical protein